MKYRRKQTRVHQFEDMLINESSKQFTIDGHVIANYSHENDLAEYGNKFNIGSRTITYANE